MIPRHDPGPSPARWLAAGLIGGASTVGMLWALLGRAPAGPIPVLPAVGEPRPGGAAQSPAPLPAPDPIQPGPGPIPAPEAEPEADPGPAAFPAAPPTAPAAVLPGAPDSGLRPAAPAVRLNINTATRAELELLPRVGPTLAGRIIEHREANGPIRSLSDLMKVKGIGARTAEALAPYIRFE